MGIFLTHANTNSVLYSFYEATQTLNSSGANQRAKYKSAYMRQGFSREDVQVIFEQLQICPEGVQLKQMQQCLLQVDSYGGCINMVAPTHTAVPQRDSILKLQYQAYWTDIKDDEAYLGWIRGFYWAMYKRFGGTPDPAKDKSGTVAGCYYNYPDMDLNNLVGYEDAMRLYFLGNLKRLKRVKRAWDPNNYFSSGQSIPLL